MKTGDRVRIDGTDSIWDGKEGIFESQDGIGDEAICTVFVDFIPEEGKRVRQNFDLQNLSLIDENFDMTKEEVLNWFRENTKQDVKESIITESNEEDIRVKKLAEYLDVSEDAITTSTWDPNVFEVMDDEKEISNDEYLVVTEDEAYNYAVEDIKNSIDELGLEAFSSDFQDWIIDNAVDKDFVDDIFAYEIDFIFDGMSDEDIIDECINNELVTEEEVYETDEDGDIDVFNYNEDLDIDDLREKLKDYQYGDYADWEKFRYLVDNFDYDYIKELIIDNNALDFEEVADEAISWDGVAHFIARYDGDEIDLGDGLFAYRQN